MSDRVDELFTGSLGDAWHLAGPDDWGRVHGTRGLYVADSALFPRASEINPYVTVMALADRVAEHIRENAGDLLAS